MTASTNGVDFLITAAVLYEVVASSENDRTRSYSPSKTPIFDS